MWGVRGSDEAGISGELNDFRSNKLAAGEADSVKQIQFGRVRPAGLLCCAHVRFNYTADLENNKGFYNHHH